MARIANPQEGVFAGASIGYTSDEQCVTPHHRPGDSDDPYGGWKGLSAHDGLTGVFVDGKEIEHGETEFIEADDGEGLEITVNGSVCQILTIEISDEELEAERERLEAEDEEFQESQPHPVLG